MESSTIDSVTSVSDYHNARSLSEWLLLKYNMRYATFHSKSKKRKDEIRAEYKADIEMPVQFSSDGSPNQKQDLYSVFRENGVKFDEFGCPIDKY